MKFKDFQKKVILGNTVTIIINFEYNFKIGNLGGCITFLEYNF